MGRGWSEIRKMFPAGVVQAQEAILAAVKAGDFVMPEFVEVAVTDGQNVARFEVATAPFQIGKPGDAVYVDVSHATSQQLADWLGWSMQTPRTVDATTRKAKGVGGFLNAGPFTAVAMWGAPPTMTTDHMEEKSVKLAQAIKPGRMSAGAWKQFVSMRRLMFPEATRIDPVTGETKLVLALGKESALQYGYFDEDGPSRSVTGEFRLYQTPGSTHPLWYSDDSELWQPMLRGVVVQRGASDPEFWDVYDLARDEELWPLISTEGTLNMHHPWLPTCQPLALGGECTGAPPSGGAKPPAPAKPIDPNDPASQSQAYDWGSLAPLVAVAMVGTTLWALS